MRGLRQVPSRWVSNPSTTRVRYMMLPMRKRCCGSNSSFAHDFIEKASIRHRCVEDNSTVSSYAARQKGASQPSRLHAALYALTGVRSYIYVGRKTCPQGTQASSGRWKIAKIRVQNREHTKLDSSRRASGWGVKTDLQSQHVRTNTNGRLKAWWYKQFGEGRTKPIVSEKTTNRMINGSALLSACGYAMTDMANLRAFQLMSASLRVTNLAVSYPKPMFLHMRWSLLFISINIVNIIKLYCERQSVDFSEAERWLYETHFESKGLSEYHCRSLFDRGEWITIDGGQTLLTEDVEHNHLYLIYSGTLDVSVGGQLVSKLHEGSWMGEMVFMDTSLENKASATCTTSGPVMLMRWKIDDLRNFLASKMQVKSQLTLAIAESSMLKIRETSQKFTSTNHIRCTSDGIANQYQSGSQGVGE